MTAGEPVAVGVDIGGTKLVAGLVGADGSVRGRLRRTTPAPRGAAGGEQALVDAVVDVVGELDADLPVGVGVAGLVDRDGVLAYGPNLAVRDLALRDLLETRLGTTVVVGNDASVAGIAEHRVGAGRGFDDVLMVTIGTGIGGAIISGGAALTGAHGFASEVGHVVVDVHGPICPCGNRGCVEAVASGTAMGRMARDGLADRTVESTLRDADEISGRTVTEAARAGDDYAIGVIVEAGRWLGIGLAGLVNVLDPGVVVIGGGAADGAGRWLRPAAAETMATHVMGRGHRPLPEVVPATLGDDAGMIGAGLLAVTP